MQRWAFPSFPWLQRMADKFCTAIKFPTAGYPWMRGDVRTRETPITAVNALIRGSRWKIVSFRWERKLAMQITWILETLWILVLNGALGSNFRAFASLSYLWYRMVSDIDDKLGGGCKIWGIISRYQNYFPPPHLQILQNHRFPHPQRLQFSVTWQRILDMWCACSFRMFPIIRRLV